jgi:hypothetical protein
MISVTPHSDDWKLATGNMMKCMVPVQVQLSYCTSSNKLQSHRICGTGRLVGWTCKEGSTLCYQLSLAYLETLAIH